MWHRAFLLGSNVAQSFFVRFRYNLGLDLSVVRIGLCAMNLQKFGVKGVCRCAAGDMELFSVVTEHRDLSTCRGKYFPVHKTEMFFLVNLQVYCLFFILFIAQSQKGLKNNGMTQSLQNPGVLKRQNSSGLFYSKTGPNTAQNLSVFCQRNLLAFMNPFYPCYNT